MFCVYIIVHHSLQEEHYGVDWSGPMSDRDDANQVDVPHTLNPLQEEDYQQLRATLPTTATSGENDRLTDGVDMFLTVLHFVCQRLVVVNVHE